MKTLSLYATPVKLEKGDLVAIVNGRLWIRADHHLYITLQEFKRLSNVPQEVQVNSAGYYHGGRKDYFYRKPKWTRYQPKIR